MSCKSAIYAVNSATQNLAVNDNVNFGQIVRRFGDNLNLSAGSVVEIGTGYYKHTAHFNVLGGATAGDLVITLYENGMPIPGAVATQSIGTGYEYSITIPAITRLNCCQEKAITAVISGVPVIVNSASILTERI